ncbi:transposase, partial [Dactylosporangium darangshiense]|uniref:transposase n=2 Tax=Dactylosporangium darangshiense TaxID=579108 RepID=UPI0031E4FF25
MADIRIRSRAARPRTRPGHVLADKAYSSKAIRSHLRRRDISATIPIKADQAPKIRETGPSTNTADLSDRVEVEFDRGGFGRLGDGDGFGVGPVGLGPVAMVGS